MRWNFARSVLPYDHFSHRYYYSHHDTLLSQAPYNKSLSSSENMMDWLRTDIADRFIWLDAFSLMSAVMLFHIISAWERLIASWALEAFDSRMFPTMTSSMTGCGKSSSAGERCGVWTYVLMFSCVFNGLELKAGRMSKIWMCCWFWRQGQTRWITVSFPEMRAIALTYKIDLVSVMLRVTIIWPKTCHEVIAG